MKACESTRDLGSCLVPLQKARRQMTAQSSVVVRLLLAVAVMVVTGLILCSARLPPLTHQVELLSVDAGASSEAHAVVWDDHEWVGIHKLYPHTLYLDNGLGRTPPLGWNR